MSRREVHTGCALQWLREHPLPAGAGIVTSLPNFDEFSNRDVDRWRSWFVDAAELVLRSTPDASACVFFQTDVKHDGVWIDKSFLVQVAAERAGVALVWHKVALRAPVGTTTNLRPAFAHLLCFSRELRHTRENATADVLARLGDQDWPRAMGRDVADVAVRWLRDHARADTIVAPFCGTGTALDAANALDLAAIGIERNPGRAHRASHDQPR
ncbi:MAG: SAM-dependent methyltransferase [Planctomycetota bacterium]